MTRLQIATVPKDRRAIEDEIARLRDLDLVALRAHWRTMVGRPPAAHLSRHLLFRILAYRLQAERFGDLDRASRRLLDAATTPEAAGWRAAQVCEIAARVQPGAVLSREWNGQMHRVAVLANGFAWNGKTYSSLSKVARAITGTRWNGPRFFGLRDKARRTGAG